MGIRSLRGRRTAVCSSSVLDEDEMSQIRNYAGKLSRSVRDRSRSATAIRRWLTEDGAEIDASVPGAHSGQDVDGTDVHVEAMSALAQRLEDLRSLLRACGPGLGANGPRADDVCPDSKWTEFDG